MVLKATKVEDDQDIIQRNASTSPKDRPHSDTKSQENMNLSTNHEMKMSTSMFHEKDTELKKIQLRSNTNCTAMNAEMLETSDKCT